MKWRMKAALTLALAVALTGCTGGSGGNAPAPGADGGDGANAGGSQQEGAPEERSEPIEISWLSFDFPQEDGTIVQRHLEERFNVKLNNIRIDRTNWKDQLNIRLASGELPDVWLLWGIADVSAYSSQNLLAELPVEEIKANIPNMAKLIDERDPFAWSNGLIDGKNYGIPITNLDGAYPLLPYYNTEWLKAIGYDAPPTTLEELEDVVYKFRNNDPDGNNRKDTYGLTGKAAASSLDESFPYVFGAFDVQPTSWVDDGNGGIVYGMTTERAREAFKLLNKWFKDGVLDPEFITADNKKHETDFANGRVGVTSASWTVMRPSQREHVKNTDTNYFDVAYGNPVAAEGYTGHALAWGLTSNYFGMGADVDKTPGKREKIYEILNAMYSDTELMKFLMFGEEGVHHDVVDGLPVVKTEVKDGMKNLGFGNFYGLLAGKAVEFEPLRLQKRDIEWRTEMSEGVPLIIDKGKFHLSSRVKYPDLPNFEKEYFIKFITGEADLDAGFDDFVAQWNRIGGEVLTQEANEIYKSNR